MNPTQDAISSSLAALTKEYQSIAHNLSNANTVGFKRHVNAFTQVLNEQLREGDTETAVGTEIQTRAGMDLSQGPIAASGRALDLALEGEGFFVLETPKGELYTRNGTFRTNDNRQLVDAAGRLVAGDPGYITLPPNASPSQIHISDSGEVKVGDQQIGRLRLVAFEDVNLLHSDGNSAFRAPDGVRPQRAENTFVRQGYREGANVNVVEELVNLITVTRLYEANVKSIKMEDKTKNHLLQVAMS